MVPRAAHRVAGDDAIAQRSAIVRALGAHCEERAGVADEEHGLVAHVANDHPAVSGVGYRDTRSEVGSNAGSLLLRHVRPPFYRIQTCRF